MKDWNNILPILRWIKKSIDTHQGAGSAAHYQPLKGWSAPYPETTGYLIDTLLDYDAVFPDLELSAAAKSCGQWLLHIQKEDGSFPVGISDPRPVIFDNGQILFGLLRMATTYPAPAWDNALLRLRTWLLQQLNPFSLRWQKHTYQPDYSPSYHTRVHWAIAKTLIPFPDAAAKKLLQQSLHAYGLDYQSDGSFNRWAFAPGEAAWTHTIAYTLRGLLEAAHLLHEPALLMLVQASLKKLTQLPRIAASYREGWTIDQEGICVTGHAQLISLLLRADDLQKNEAYVQTAQRLWQDIAHAPAHMPWPGIRGGVPGSIPFYKGYKARTYPNWAAKFYLDAFWALKRL